jgi:hypothetical protein
VDRVSASFRGAGPVVVSGTSAKRRSACRAQRVGGYVAGETAELASLAGVSEADDLRFHSGVSELSGSRRARVVTSSGELETTRSLLLGRACVVARALEPREPEVRPDADHCHGGGPYLYDARWGEVGATAA